MGMLGTRVAFRRGRIATQPSLKLCQLDSLDSTGDFDMSAFLSCLFRWNLFLIFFVAAGGLIEFIPQCCGDENVRCAMKTMWWSVLGGSCCVDYRLEQGSTTRRRLCARVWRMVAIVDFGDLLKRERSFVVQGLNDGSRWAGTQRGAPLMGAGKQRKHTCAVRAPRSRSELLNLQRTRFLSCVSIWTPLALASSECTSELSSRTGEELER